MRYLLYTLTAAILLTACAKSDFSDDNSSIPAGMGELIPSRLLISSELFPETEESETEEPTATRATSLVRSASRSAV